MIVATSCERLGLPGERVFAPENAYLAACAARARARLTGTKAAMRSAAALVDEMGAAFERDITLLLGA